MKACANKIFQDLYVCFILHCHVIIGVVDKFCALQNNLNFGNFD